MKSEEELRDLLMELRVKRENVADSGFTDLIRVIDAKIYLLRWALGE